MEYKKEVLANCTSKINRKLNEISDEKNILPFSGILTTFGNRSNRIAVTGHLE
jgi:hypothetical protein